jgi:group II intron reverse transcriptase/maturase
MQKAEVVPGVLRERGRRGLPCEQLYRQMFNKDLYLMAYGNIYSSQGAMTPGASRETADGMSEDKIEHITGLMRREKYRFSPARRTYIPEKNGKLRPLGLPSWSGKLVCEVVRILLEAYCEPTFSSRSHGFRRGKGCHTALREISQTWTGTVWFIEGDISGCSGSPDHQVMLTILAEKIHDNRFLRLIRNMPEAASAEDREYHPAFSGCPQGSVVSPVLSNICLHKPGEFIEQKLIPHYTRGTARRRNPGYSGLEYRLGKARKSGDRAAARRMQKQKREIPAGDPADPGYRRLTYTRYADDHILGSAGPRAEAEQVKAAIAEFLKETLKLELNDARTLITHARTQRARFPGYDITVQHNNTKLTDGRRKVNGQIALKVPPDVIKAQCARYRQHGKPWLRPELQNLDDYDTVRIYGAEYRGAVNYYLLAHDVYRLHTLWWHNVTSMLKTLAAKHHSTVSKMAARHKAKTETRNGLRTCFEAKRKREGKKDLVARSGGIILQRDRHAEIRDALPGPAAYPRKELISRLRKRECELCETGTTVAVHQIADLKALGQPGPGQPAWAALMAIKRRKTLIVCADCHEWIHANPVAHAA